MQPTAVSSHTPGLTGCTHTTHTHTHTRFASGAGGGRARRDLPDGRVTPRAVPLGLRHGARPPQCPDPTSRGPFTPAGCPGGPAGSRDQPPGREMGSAAAPFRRSGAEAAAATYLPAGPPRPRPCRGCAAARLEAALTGRGGAGRYGTSRRCGAVLPAPRCRLWSGRGASHSPALRAGWPRRALPAPSRRGGCRAGRNLTCGRRGMRG